VLLSLKTRMEGFVSLIPLIIDTIGLEDTLEEEFTLRTPTTFLDVFENTLSNRGKGD
jgi:hypothetical protein